MIMKSVQFILFLLVSASVFISCSQKPFDADPLCDTCIEKACTGTAEDLSHLVRHFSASPAPVQAQLLSRMEAFEGCTSHLDAHTTSALYDRYGASFFAVTQPYVSERVYRAAESIRTGNPTRTHAASYLRHHADTLRKDDKTFAHVESSLFPLAETKPEVFSLLCALLPQEKLSLLAAMPPDEARDLALLPHYEVLDESTRHRLLKPYVFGNWHMQASGSTVLPQYLELDWGMLPVPDGVAQPVAVIDVKSVSIRGEEAKKRGTYVKNAFSDAPLLRPDRHKRRVDIGAWLKQADTFRIAAHAVISLWPGNAPQACLSHDDACSEKPLATYPVKLDMQYRAYIGVDTGAPRRNKSAEENAPTTKALNLQICNETACTPLWDQKLVPQKARTSLDVTQGHDFYLLAVTAGASLPVAGRLMARSMPGATWQEIATFFSYAPSRYAPPVRADIDVSSVCRDLGKCELELQLRPSLRMARRDPAITQYWGETLDLGKLAIHIQNRTPQQIYREIL